MYYFVKILFHLSERPNSTSSTTWPLRWYRIPLSLAFPHGLYALMGHQPKPGTAPIPPIIRPLPSQPKDISERGTPQVGHASDGLGVGSAAELLGVAWRAQKISMRETVRSGWLLTMRNLVVCILKWQTSTGSPLLPGIG